MREKLIGWEIWFRDIYHEYWNARANVLIAIGIIALAIGIYRFKIKKTNKIIEKDSNIDNKKNNK